MTAAQMVLRLRPEQVAQHPDNLRDPNRDLSGLAASIKEVGVLVPLIVVPAAAVDGEWPADVTHVAVDGNRRQLAALQVGVDLPCIVRDDLAAARDTAVTMTVTGLARDGWTMAEEINGIQTLLDLGLSQSAISRASGRKTTEVRAAKKAATLKPKTAATAAAYDLTLDQLAILSEWQHNDEAVATLLDAVQYGQMDHAVARLVRERKAADECAATVERLTTAGITVTPSRPGLYSLPYRLDALTTADGAAPTDEEHRTCPGHAIHVTANYTGEVTQIICCTADPATTEHQPRYTQTPEPTTGPMTEKQKADRRELIRCNKETSVDCTR